MDESLIACRIARFELSSSDVLLAPFQPLYRIKEEA
jgi:hypothetical protein